LDEFEFMSFNSRRMRAGHTLQIGSPGRCNDKMKPISGSTHGGLIGAA
jgi:hypothetical protein